MPGSLKSVLSPDSCESGQQLRAAIALESVEVCVE